MKELKNFKGVIIFLLILTVLNAILTNRTNSVEYVQGNVETTDTEVAANM